MMATHDGGKRETRARMKDRQCASAIVCRQAQGPKQTHGAEWQCPGMGGFGSRKKERQKDSKTMMLLSKTHKNSGKKEHNEEHERTQEKISHQPKVSVLDNLEKQKWHI